SLVGVLTGGPVAPRLVVSSLNHVEQVRIDAVGHEALTEIIEIDAPRIRGAVGKDFEDETSGMDAVHTTIAVIPLVGRGAWAPDVRGAGATVTRVEPAVRSPGEAVGEVVPALLITEPVEDHARLARRLVIAVAVGNEPEVWRRHDPHAAEADLD